MSPAPDATRRREVTSVASPVPLRPRSTRRGGTTTCLLSARQRLRDAHRLRHPLARERPSTAANRLHDQDRGAPLVRRQRRAEARRGAPSARNHVRRVLRPVPRAARRDRREADAGDARGAARGVPGAVRRLDAARARGRRRDVAAWRAGLSDTSRYRLTSAMRQALGAAVRWRYIGRNPAVDAGKNPQPRREEFCPFTRDEIDALEVELGPTTGRWSSSPPRPACGRTSGSRWSAATSTGPGRRSRCSAASPTASSPRTRRRSARGGGCR